MTVNQPSAPVDPAPVESSVPQELVISSAKPQGRELAQAILAAFSAPESFHLTDVFNLPHPLVVFNNLDVKNVKLHGNRGSAQVRIATSLSVSGGQVNMRPHQETQTWTLLRRDRKELESIGSAKRNLCVSRYGGKNAVSPTCIGGR